MVAGAGFEPTAFGL